MCTTSDEVQRVPRERTLYKEIIWWGTSPWGGLASSRLAADRDNCFTNASITMLLRLG